MTKWSRHASGSDAIEKFSTVFAVVVSMSSPFHRAPFWTHRYRQVPALGSWYGVVVGWKPTLINT